MKKVVILTGSELRHSFFRKAFGLNSGIDVLKSYCEFTSGCLAKVIDNESCGASVQIKHLEKRSLSETDFFGSFVEYTPDLSNPEFVAYGAINADTNVQEIIALNPDVIVSYGCSLIKEPLVKAFEGRFVNVHLGLSPYYRGGGTNFWPLVNKEPEYVGATFMHIDLGVDTGDIIHQIRARCFADDNTHQIGNRLISDMAGVFMELIINFDNLEKMIQPERSESDRYYRSRDFTPEATHTVYQNFDAGMVKEYLHDYEERVRNVPLVVNPVLVNEE